MKATVSPAAAFARVAIAGLAALALSACAARPWASPVEVTRFVGTAPAELGRGTISIEPAAGFDPQSLEFGLFAAQLEGELAALGYRVVPQGGAQVATLALNQAVEHPLQRRGPVSVGGSASTGSYGSGVGLGVGIDLSGPKPDEVSTLVSVAIRPANGGANLWEGRAGFTATANSPLADPAAAAARAIDALFTGFPGNSGETVIVQ